MACSDGEGPDFVAVDVTSPFPAPFHISSYYYNVFTNVAPDITEFTFAVWSGGDVPGTLVGSQSDLDMSPGYHTVPVVPPVEVHSNQFFFGSIQPQVIQYQHLRLGFDTSSGGGDGKSFVKAPGCGLSSWVTVTSVGFSGNWAMAVCLSRPVPVELESWGQIKDGWN